MNLNQKQKKVIRGLAKVSFIIYMIVLVYFLFFSERYGRGIGSTGYHYNLELFKEIKRFIKYRDLLGVESFVVNIFGNIFAFSPFGFALPIISPKNRHFINVVLLSFEFSLTVEVLQLIYKVGIFDVDDLFMNTLGGAIGYITFYICVKIFIRSRKNDGEEREKPPLGKKTE